jgi:hypothetical protein
MLLGVTRLLGLIGATIFLRKLGGRISGDNCSNFEKVQEYSKFIVRWKGLRAAY